MEAIALALACAALIGAGSFNYYVLQRFDEILLMFQFHRERLDKLEKEIENK